MRFYLPKSILLLSLALLSLPQIQAQESWQKIAPFGESFTVLMPTRAVEVSRIIPLNEKDSVPERVYFSIANGRRYMVVSFVRTSPDRVLALSSFSEFIRAMELSFTGKEGQIRSLTFDTDLSDESGMVKQYHLHLDEYRGVARFIGNEKAFYALMVIGADETEPDVRRFLSSFLVGKPNEDPKETGVSSNSLLTGISSDNPSSQQGPPEPWPRTAGPIIGGVVNGKAVYLPVPRYPKAARENHDSGQVKVRIVIDEFGSVINAEAIEGPESLREAAVGAAWNARFTPTRLMGQPVKVTGVIIYNFVSQ